MSSQDRRPEQAPLAFLAGGGEMGGRCRAFPWQDTPLGPVESWPQSLRSAVSILLPSRAQIILFWGPEFVCIYNDAYRPIFGSRHPWALGKPGAEAWSVVWNVLGPLLQGVVQTGEAFWAQDLPFFLDREGYLEETYFDVSYDPVRDETGSVGGVFCIVSETTARVLSERRLRTLRDLGTRATMVVDSVAAAGAAAVDIVAQNPRDVPFALLYLYRPAASPAWRLSAVTGSSEAAVRHAGLLDGAAWPLQGVVDSRSAHLVEGLSLPDLGLEGLPEGRTPTQAVVLPLSASERGRALGALVVGVSVVRALDGAYSDFFALLAQHVSTALASATAYEEERGRAEALAELDRAKTVFFNNVSHEFRTPLTLMLGPLEEMLARADSPSRAADHAQLDTVHRNAIRLHKLVNTLLDFSRIEAGRVHAAFEPTDLAALTLELASVFRSAIEKAGLKLVVDCPPLPERVYVDRDMWEKIVLNFLSNALKFTFEGEIEVALRCRDRQVELRVRDTGTGIRPEEMPRLFERFHRVEGARGRTLEGTGIGLAFVHELVKLHGGTVRAESTLDRGSTFSVSVPLGSAHLPAERIGAGRALTPTALAAEHFVQEALRWLPEAASERTTPPAPAEADGHPEPSVDRLTIGARRPRVLLADDNADMRRYLRRLLAGPYDVEAVADGHAAWAAAQARRPDLVLCDVMMPQLDGFGLLGRLRSHEELRTIPVILLSARAGEEARVEGLQAGASDYLVKPFHARELTARVGAALELAGVRRQASEALQRELDDTRRLAEISTRLLGEGHVDGLLDEILSAATALLGSDMGVLQLLDPETNDLRIRAQRGLSPPFLDYFARVGPDSPSVCGRALDSARRTLVPDVETSDAFNQESLAVAREAGVRSVQSTPLLTRSGKTLGMLSTHWREVHQPAERELRLLDLLTRQAADLVERAQAEDVLREADRRKSEFLAMLAHELRNPLAPIRNALHVLQRTSAGDAVRPAIDMMQRQVAQMVRLIDDLLDVSRVSRGKIELRKQGVDLASVASQAVEAARPLAETMGQEVTLSLPATPIYVDADPARLAQVLGNLLSNACKFTGRNGHIRLRVERDGAQAVIRVTDDGVGLAADQLTRIFEMFAQVDSSLERAQGGLGIGLTLARTLVEMHGGTVQAVSAGPGQGSEFVVRLPVPVALPPPDEPVAETPVPSARRILVVDDNHDSAESLAAMFRMSGHEVHLAHDGLEAVAAAARLQPDVILLDIGLPKLNGYEAARRIRSQRSDQGLALVALTGWGQAEDRRRSEEAGFDVHLVKPVDPAVLTKLLLTPPTRR